MLFNDIWVSLKVSNFSQQGDFENRRCSNSIIIYERVEIRAQKTKNEEKQNKKEIN